MAANPKRAEQVPQVELSNFEEICPDDLWKEIQERYEETVAKVLKLPNKNPRLVSCPVCGSKGLKPYLPKNGIQIDHCPKCDFRFTNPYPSMEQLSSYYNSEVKGLENLFFQKTKEVRLRIFENRVGILQRFCDSGELLDVGGSLGFFVEALIRKKSNFHMNVVDLNKQSCDLLKKSFPQVAVYNQDVMDHKGEYDVITLWDTLEHLPQLGGVMTKLTSLLRDKGYLLISTPNTHSFEQMIGGEKHPQLAPPAHVNYFNEQNLRILFSNNNLEVLEALTPNGSFDVAYVKSLIKDKTVDKERLGEFLYDALSDENFSRMFSEAISKSRLAGNIVVMAQYAKP
ncbi:MAG: methyltransferase domain-containing protein [Candidatus Altiarchaeota archaeon]|nr:methyltransferase domain-containing protein [Candidatus Altiarchaeota archaeon]